MNNQAGKINQYDGADMYEPNGAALFQLLNDRVDRLACDS
jgi:hypothetical protein